MKELGGFNVRDIDLLSILPYTQGKCTTVGLCRTPALFVYADGT